MWNDRFIKAPSETDFIAALPADWLDNGAPILFSEDVAMDVLGTIYSGGTFDVQGNVLTPPTAIAGWHVNMRVRDGTVLPVALAAFEVAEPAFPKRVFSDE
jgi:hypothetical protein